MNGTINPAITIKIDPAFGKRPDSYRRPFKYLLTMNRSTAKRIAVNINISIIAECADESPMKFSHGIIPAISLLPYRVARSGNRTRRLIDTVTHAAKYMINFSTRHKLVR